MSEEFDEQNGPEQDDVEAHGAETDVKPDVEPDDDSDVEGHLFQRR